MNLCFRILVACLGTCLFFLDAFADERIRVDVDATTTLVINGIDQVRDSLFGLDGAEGGNHEEQQAANMHTATGSSAGIGGVAEDPQRPGQIDRAKLQAYLDTAKPSIGGFRIDHYLHCLQGGPGWQTGPKERRGYVIPQDLDVYSEWAEAVVRHRLKTMPNTEHYFQFFGEISLMGYWSGPGILRDPTRESTNRTGRIGAQQLINVITASHRRLDQAGLDVRLGTPGVTNALQWSNWRTWRSWFEPMVDQLGDKVSFYGLHWYDMTRDMLEVEAGILQNAQEIRWGNRLPICVQESDYTQGPMDDPRKGPFNAYYLWSLLDMPDKVMVNTAHLRDLGGTIPHNMFRAGRRLPKYWSYWILGDLRGTMLDVDVTGRQSPGNPDESVGLRSLTASAPGSSFLTRPAIASRRRGGRLWLFPQDRGIRARAASGGNRVCVVVWNDSPDEDKQVDLRVVLPDGCRAVNAERKHVFFDSDGLPRHESEHGVEAIDWKQQDDELALSLDTKADTIYSVTVDFEQPLKQIKTAWIRQFFGDQIMFKVPGHSNFTDVANPSPEAFQTLLSPEVVIRSDLVGARSARLKIALDKPRGDWEDTVAVVNGREYLLPTTEHVKRVALVEVPVDLVDLDDGKVKVDFQPHSGEPYRVVWASLVISNKPDRQSVAPLVAKLEDDRFGVHPGETLEPRCSFVNKSSQSIEAMLRWVLPDGWTIQQEPASTMTLEPNERMVKKLTVRVADSEPRVEYQQIAAIVEFPCGKLVTRKSYKLNAPVPCRKFSSPPKIDGDLSDWKGRAPIKLNIKERNVQLWTGWDVDNWYLAAIIPQSKDRGGTIPRSVEALHLFLDLGNEKGVYNYDANDHHFWFVTPGLATPEKAANWRLPLSSPPEGVELGAEEKEGLRWHKAYVGQTFWQGPLSKLKVPDYPFTRMECRAVEGGYTIEASIGGAWSWSAPEQSIYGFWPEAGHTIGFDFVCDDNGVDPISHSVYWGCGFEQLHRYYFGHPREQVRGNPAAWGLLRFEE